MASVIDCKTERVWRAITDPAELVSWDPHVLAPVDGLDRYPFRGQHARWRYQLGSVQLVMHDRPLEVDPRSRLRSRLNVGTLDYERTFTLQGEPGGGTRLSMRLVTPNSIPLIGESVDRFDMRRMSTERVDESLRAVQAWCEANP